MNISATMRELGIDKENFRTLGLLPLVFVAWADGTVQRAESVLIRRVARDKGWLVGNGETLLDRWLAEEPDAEYVSKGLGLLKELTEARHGLGNAVTVDTLSNLLVLCKDVAEAAGGLWGLAESITTEEEQALMAIAEAFGIGDAKTWRRIVTEIEAAPAPRAPGPKGSVLVGELRSIVNDPIGLLMRCLNEHGDVVRIRMPGMEWFLISHPDHIKHVLIDQARNYIRGKSSERAKVLVGNSIVTTDGDEWRPLRRIAQPAFHRQSISTMGEMMTRYTTEMVDQWAQRFEPGAPFDASAEIQKVTLRIIGQALFSMDLQDTANTLSDAVPVALEWASGLTNPFRLPSSIPTPSNRRFARAMKVFESFVFATLAARQESQEHPHDLMSMLLDAVDPDSGEGLNHVQIRNEMLTYLLAGHETSANTLVWLFYLLSRHPEVARRLDDELRRELGGAVPTVAQLDRLVYLEQVLLETMRLYPVAYMVLREVVSEDRIGGFTIPAKAWVMVAPYVTHRRPELWENPEGFDPDRFAPDKPAPAPCAYFPFMAGLHKCVGQPLAMMEMKLIVATVMRRCWLDLVPGFEPGLEAGLTLRPKNGMMMRLRWRDGAEAGAGAGAEAGAGAGTGSDPQ